MNSHINHNMFDHNSSTCQSIRTHSWSYFLPNLVQHHYLRWLQLKQVSRDDTVSWTKKIHHISENCHIRKAGKHWTLIIIYLRIITLEKLVNTGLTLVQVTLSWLPSTLFLFAIAFFHLVLSCWNLIVNCVMIKTFLNRALDLNASKLSSLTHPAKTWNNFQWC